MRPSLLLGVSVLWVPLAFLFDGVTVLLLPVRLGGDASVFGVVSLVGIGVAALFQPVVGWLSDRYRERVDRRLFIAVAALPAALGLWLLAGTQGLAAAVIGYVVIQAAATAIQAGQQTLIPEHVGEPAQGRAAGLKSLFDVGGAVIAFAVFGMALNATGGLGGAALVATVALVLGVALVFVLVPGRAGPRGRAEARPSRPGRPTFDLRLPPGLGPLILARFLFLLGTYGVGRFLSFLVAQRFGLDPIRAAGDTGAMLVIFTIATALAALLFGWLADRWPRRELMAFGALVTAVGVLVLVPSAGPVGVLVGGLVMAAGTAAFVTANWAATTAIVPPADAGRLMAIANLGTGLAAAAAGALGFVLSYVGFEPVLLFSAIAAAAAVLPLVAVGARNAPETAT